MLNVSLVGAIPDTQKLPELAAAVCVNHENKHPCKRGTSNYTEDVDGLAKGLEVAVNSGHLSVLEHTSISWLVEGLSRAASHQLVRHRLASYAQQSQRHCKVSTDNQDWYVIPDFIAHNPQAKLAYYKAMNGIATIYDELLALGIPKEDARMVLPNACKTTILITMNARAFIEAAEKRLCNRAQWEIRGMFNLMRERIKYTHPLVYKLAVPRCAKHGCIEAKPCGRPW